MSKYIFLFKVDFIITKQEVLSDITHDWMNQIEINEGLIDFIKKNKERCYILVDNNNEWIENLLRQRGLEEVTLCTHISTMPFVAVGNGRNDIEMIKIARIGIGYGAYRKIFPTVLSYASHAIYEEAKLIEFLGKLL